MNRYMSIVCSVMFVGLVALPCQGLAANITPTRAEIGWNCAAIGGYSTAMGYSTEASGYASTAMGDDTRAGNVGSTAMGSLTIADGTYSFAGGRYMQLTGAANHTFVWGYSPTEESISAPDAFLIFPAGTPGRVGIGTKSPQNLLDLGETQGKKLAVFQKTTGADFYGFGISSGTLEIYAGADSDGEPAMVVKKTTGNIGIGTDTPAYKLEVNGDAAKTSGGTVWINSSDERLKDITGEYGRGLDAITRLRPVTFFYKQGNPRGLPTHEENIGFIAQEVQEVFPEAVSEGKAGYLDFNMHPVNVALVNAVKELKAENDALRQEIQQIKAALVMGQRDALLKFN